MAHLIDRSENAIRLRQSSPFAGAKMERAVALNAWGAPIRLKAPWWVWNLMGEQAVFLLSRRG